MAMMTDRPGSTRLLPWALAAVAGLALLGTGCRRDGDASSKPNLVLIVIDTLRADKMSAYGFPRPTSPDLDQLAAEGVRFATVIAQSSWTRPSLGSMLTSRYPRTVGIYKEELEMLDGRFDTLAESLKAAGYTTVGSTANPNINSSFGFDQGFDHYIDSDVLWSWMDQEHGKRSSAKHPLPTAGEVFDRALSWIDEHGAPPYYLQLIVMEVHEARRVFVRRRVDSTLFEDDPVYHYLQALHLVSGEVGGFVRTLSGRPGWKNTLFVITSDHGEGLFSHPDVAASQGHGDLLYQSQLVVPLILYHPAGGLPAGTIIDDRVRLLDLMPTLLEYAGVNGPGAMEGSSLMPLIRNDGPVSLPKEFMVETERKVSEKIGIYTPAWEYIENRDRHGGTNPIELQAFGTTENGAKTDVASRHPDLTRELGAFVSEWERSHPKAPPTLQGNEMSPAELEQLRSLGYID
jgi:arylsulfatase A-like enzyme